jgi:hypothetical protein
MNDHLKKVSDYRLQLSEKLQGGYRYFWLGQVKTAAVFQCANRLLNFAGMAMVNSISAAGAV